MSDTPTSWNLNTGPDGIEITSNLASVEERLTKLVEAVADLRPFWPMVVPLFVKWMGEQFETSGEFFGDHWAPLSADYAAWKTVNYPGRGILMAEGDLRHAAQTPRRHATAQTLTLVIEPFTKQRGRGAGREIEPAWFQEGTDKMPARPLLPLSGELTPNAEADVGRAAEAYLQDTAARLGLL